MAVVIRSCEVRCGSAVRPTILLFDIDGTLITTGGVGRRAIEGAFEERYGRGDACTSFRFDGMTDRLIARQALTILGVEPTDAAIDDILAVYVRLLEVEVARADDKYRLHLGIAEALGSSNGTAWAWASAPGTFAKERASSSRASGSSNGSRSVASDRTPRIAPPWCVAVPSAAPNTWGYHSPSAAWSSSATRRKTSMRRAPSARNRSASERVDFRQVLHEHGATRAFDSLASPGALDAMLGR